MTARRPTPDFELTMIAEHGHDAILESIFSNDLRHENLPRVQTSILAFPIKKSNIPHQSVPPNDFFKTQDLSFASGCQGPLNADQTACLWINTTYMRLGFRHKHQGVEPQ